MTMEYIPNALAFIFVVNVVNVVNAGGLQDDRVRLFFNLKTIIGSNYIQYQDKIRM